MVDYTNAPRNDYFCLDARSFYASCEAVKRGFDPNKVFLVVVGDLNYSGSMMLQVRLTVQNKPLSDYTGKLRESAYVGTTFSATLKSTTVSRNVEVHCDTLGKTKTWSGI
ncbi:hypothetical protein [Aneurinibacillus aneurinilyticus]|nr:hypothetical protein [Aneurinibacillus aneurinilyticus]MED0706287.1 hypothetical protein [Aneurinibacillus aneurinilyticus]MED0725301.1 hypothetical protein [Aneurinibacillus aneurinilyticus]MED0732285.1 hypothetical protein [Aneurinibacillus aneurinilyticus]MED0741457.1 hypothetical protein [Aneurinibacillus aneurinilyticus]